MTTDLGFKRLAFATIGIWLGTAIPAGAQVMFTHGAGTSGVAGKRQNDILAAPDTGDVFYSNAKLCRPHATRNDGNQRVFDDSLLQIPEFWLGISDADHIDAMQIGVVNIFARKRFDLNLAFSVEPGATGAAGTRVATEAPDNGAHLYSSSGLGWNANCTNALQMGLSGASDVDSLCANRSFKKLVRDPVNTPILFSLSTGSPFLAAASVTPSDILFVIPGPAAFPALLIEGADLGLDGDDELDALAVIAPTVLTQANQSPYVVLFSVGSGADGLPGTAVATGGPADVFWSVGDGTNHLFRSAADLGLDTADELDALDVLTRGRVRHPDGQRIPRVTPLEGCARGGLEVGLQGGDGQGSVSLSVRIRAGSGQELVVSSEQVTLDNCQDPVEVELALLMSMASMAITDPVSGFRTPLFNTPSRRRTIPFDGSLVQTSLELRAHPKLHSLDCCLVGAAVLFDGDCRAATLEFPKLQRNKVPATELAFFMGGTAALAGNLLLQFNGMREPLSIAVLPGDDHDALAAKIAAQLSEWTVVVSPGQPVRITADSQAGPVVQVDRLGLDRANMGLSFEVELRLYP